LTESALGCTDSRGVKKSFSEKLLYTRF